MSPHPKKAGARLGITHGAISRRIASLEGRLNTNLFIRTPEGVRLTDEGVILLEASQEMAQAAAKFDTAAKHLQVKRPVQVMAPEGILSSVLSPLIHREEFGAFRRVVAKIPPSYLRDVNLVLDTSPEQSDFWFVWSVPGRIPAAAEGYVVRKVTSIRLLPHYSQEYERTSGHIENLEDLRHHRLATHVAFDRFNHPKSLGPWLEMVQRNEHPAGVARVQTSAAYDRMAVHGGAVCLLPVWGKLVNPTLRLCINVPRMELDMWVIVSKLNLRFPRIRTVYETLNMAIKEIGSL